MPVYTRQDLSIIRGSGLCGRGDRKLRQAGRQGRRVHPEDRGGIRRFEPVKGEGEAIRLPAPVMYLPNLFPAQRPILRWVFAYFLP